MSSDNNVWTVLSMLEWATDYFEKQKVPSSRHSIEWLLADVLNCKRLNLYLQYDRPLSPDELEQLRPMVKRRAGHEPLQYILGYAEFMDCKIYVNPSVLIPRIETEQLVEIFLEKTRHLADDKINLLDVGTGSGCIAIAIKKNRPAWNCYGTDICDNAIKVAKRNAEENNADVHFFKGDLFDQQTLSAAPWNLIISNPPYIAPDEREKIDKQVKDFEPEGALFHQNPVEVYDAIIQYARAQNADLYLELNNKSAKQINQIANTHYSRSELLKDFDNNERFLTTAL